MESKRLLGLHVETVSGIPLGTVKGFTFDPSSHTILQYEVQRGVFGKSLLVNAKQVISITEEKVVVEDLLIAEAAKASLNATPA